MGTIYQARDTVLRRVVALKVLPRDYVSQREHRERFIREAQAAAKIHHRNVVAVHDVSVNDPLYIVMEYLEGETFEALLRREAPVSFERALTLLLPVMSAVAAAHESRVIHRDLKPANIMLSRERDGTVTPKVLDFGISKLSKVTREFRAVSPRDLNLTDREAQIGTPNYMAPEQDGSNHAVGPWSDGYALALMLYRAVTGRLPFSGRNMVEVLYRKRHGVFAAPSEFPFGLPQTLDAWMRRALAPDPAERFSTVVEMARALLPMASDALQTRWMPTFEPSLDDSDPSTVPPPQSEAVTALEIPIEATLGQSDTMTSTPDAPVAAPRNARFTPRERALAGALAALSLATAALASRELRRTPAVTVVSTVQAVTPRTLEPLPATVPWVEAPVPTPAPAPPPVVVPAAASVGAAPVRTFVRPPRPPRAVPLGDGVFVTAPTLGGRR